ncbi:Thioredoxin-1 [Rosistilla oblonga]|uniref:trypsin-like peptidase domain-containing protein n=1 Tax=Rosistilla oblonga TaxID=2527990 RepID=UPI001189727D|nr:trypsin-like peptidase domain-containing protein [Rosistilla oblonga]QDV10339.1 Thioredoxin-1 [Rosistilla oblonga]
MHMLCYLLLAAGVSGSSDSVLVEFTQPGCHACVTMEPVVGQLQREGVAIRRVDAARESHLVQRYRVTSFPTYLVLSGGREIARLQGTQPIQTLRQALANRQGQRIRDTGARNVQPEVPQTPLSAVAASPVSQAIPGEAMPSIDLAQAVERAQAATVRIRVREQGAVGVATGTIIDTHGEEALVLTCGHVFRDSQGKAPIEVELFIQGQIHTVPGQLIDYEAKTRDIALVSIKPGFPVQPVPVISKDQLPTSGTAAFSFGCDRGADPTRRDTRITAVNKYNQHLGASNLEIAGAPTIGRSGGGLFDHQGRIVGVCNAADFEDDIGIYAGPGTIQWQLDRVNLASLYQPRAAVAAATPRSNVPAPPTRLAAVTSPAASAPAAQIASNQEVIVILRDKNRPDNPTKIKTFDQPTPDMLKLLGLTR